MTTPIFTPPGNLWHADVVPYLSTDDYANAPTGVDVTQLIPGGSASANLIELANVIRRASRWANALCDQILAATLDTEQAAGVYVRRDGTVWLPCTYWPILELDTFQAGPTPGTLTAVTDTANITLQGRKVLIVPVAGLVGPSGTPGFVATGPLRPGGRAYVQWSYWNGWPHTTLAADAAQSATSIVVTNSMPAALAGRTMQIADGAATESITVAATFTGGTTLPLTAGLAHAHTVPAAPKSIVVTSLADDARQGVISLTSCLIKTRGTAAQVMESIGEAPRKKALIDSGGLEDYEVACDALRWYRRVT